MASSDLMGSILVKILHCSEGKSVELVVETLKYFFCFCDCPSLSIYSLMFISCMPYYLPIVCAYTYLNQKSN